MTEFQEPWAVDDAGAGVPEILTAHRQPVACASAVTPTQMLPIGERYARRIVACVNACVGIPTEQLETLCRGTFQLDDSFMSWRCGRCNYAIRERRQGPHWFDVAIMQVRFL